MRTTRLAATAALPALLLAALPLPGCVSIKRTPGARFFVLRSTVDPKPPGSLPEAPQGAVALLPVVIPGALDRPQLVTWQAPNELRLDELARWAEPLGDGVTRTLAEDLSALLPHRILRAPWPAAAVLRCRIATELRVFGLQPDGEVRLEAGVLLLAPRDERVLARRTFAASRKPAGGSTLASVDAMSELLADLAKEIAEAVDGLPTPAQSPAMAP